MKSYLQKAKYLKHAAAATRASMKKKCLSYKRKRKKRLVIWLEYLLFRTQQRAKPLNKTFKNMPAPEDFSFIDNTEDLLAYFRECNEVLQYNYKISLNLTEIKNLSPDAIALLIANMKHKDFNPRELPIHGKTPNNKRLANLLGQSGFFDYVNTEDKKSTYFTSNQNLLLHTETDTKVHPKIAKEASVRGVKHTFGSEKIFSPLYEILIECMSNTNNHASANKKELHNWWLQVYLNPSTKITSYSFIDLGIGVFESYTVREYKLYTIIMSWLYSITSTTNIDILEDILKGKVRSSTGKPERGKGLPQIFKHSKDPNIGKFIIISNDVYADIKNEKYLLLKNNDFRGTFLYWELHPKINQDENRQNY